MPELPEVEVTRRSFAQAIEGAQILHVRLGKALRWPLGCASQDLVGQRVHAVARRAKYLLLQIDHGWLLIHLGMSGSLRFSAQPGMAGPHDHFDCETSQGVLRLTDPRRFGAVVYVPDLQQGMGAKLLGKLGPEPLEPAFAPLAFYQALRQRHGAIKPALMGGELVVGVGNIYASEALFQAGIRPTTRVDRLSRARAARLHRAVVQVLSQAVALGGSTLRNFSAADGAAGHFQMQAQVYGRAGQACHRCQTPIKHIVQAQRSTYFCPVCQRP